MDLTSLRQEENEACRERDKVEEMLFHEVVFDLMLGVEQNLILGTENAKEVDKETVRKVLGEAVRDGTDYKINLKRLGRVLNVKPGDPEFQRLEFVCKYFLKKNLRRKTKKSNNRLRPVVNSRSSNRRVRRNLRFSAEDFEEIPENDSRLEELPGPTQAHQGKGEEEAGKAGGDAAEEKGQGSPRVHLQSPNFEEKVGDGPSVRQTL